MNYITFASRLDLAGAQERSITPKSTPSESNIRNCIGILVITSLFSPSSYQYRPEMSSTTALIRSHVFRY